MMEAQDRLTTGVDGESADPLLACLVFLTAHFGNSKSTQAVVAGLAYDTRNMGPDLFCEAAGRLGYQTRVVQRRDLEKIPAPVLPAVLILRDKKACVLRSFGADGRSVTVWLPEFREERILSLETFAKSYSGYAIFIHPQPLVQSLGQTKDWHENWFWGPVWEARGIYAKVFISAIMINLFALVSPIFMMNVYNRVLPNNALETGWVLAIGALSVFVFDFIMRTLRGYFVDLAGRRIDVIAARKIYDQLINMKLSARPKSSGAFANMLRDFDAVREFMNSATLTGLVDLPFAILFLVVIGLIGGKIAVLLTGLFVVVIAAGALFQIPLQGAVRKATRSAEAKHGLLVETITGLETIKAILADGRLRARYGDYVAENALHSQDSRFYSALGVNFSVFIQQIASIIVVLVGMYMVQDKSMSVGSLIACVMLSGRALSPIGQIANLMSRYHAARSAKKTIDTIMCKPVERPSHVNFLHRPHLDGKVAFKDVGFFYPDTQRKILNKVSFSILPGEKVGIIGRVGSGKSTIARLVMGLYEPQEGTILVDDTDYKQIDPADLRRSVAYIAQDVVLFSGTIRENLTVSVPHATDEAILQAAKDSGVHDFVSRHPMGYDAPVGERGEGLSGGQRQAIALARALLLKPSVFVCDEPTNAMDTQAEQAFTNYISHQSKEQTLVLITHRQPLLNLVDRLILIDQGQVVMDGPRQKVLEAMVRGVEI